jgi:hypothetical protein
LRADGQEEGQGFDKLSPNGLGMKPRRRMMFKIGLTITLGTAALLSGCATTGSMVEMQEDPGVTKALAGRTAGEPRDCLSLNDTRQSSTYRGTILYRTSSKLTYRNDMNGCTSLSDDRIPIIEVRGSQICRGDIVRLADRTSGAQWGACTFGNFVPYRAGGG